MKKGKIMKVGIDILDAQRMEKLAKNSEQLCKIFTDYEIEHFNKSNGYLPRLAGMYSAKEAFLKALGVGIRNGISFQEIEVFHDELGKPEYRLSSRVKDVLKSLKITSAELSISHTDNFATAICIMQ